MASIWKYFALLWLRQVAALAMVIFYRGGDHATVYARTFVTIVQYFTEADEAYDNEYGTCSSL